MTQIKHVRSDNPAAKDLPVMCLIPGGPGLSSNTLKDLECLSRSFDLAFVNPPGTGPSAALEAPNFYKILYDVEAAIDLLGRPIVLVGHSFGGIYAAELALRLRLPVEGLVFLAAPITPGRLEAVSASYKKNMTIDLKRAEKNWAEAPSNRTFCEWMFHCVFFPERCQEKGKAMILKDLTSFETFLGARSDWRPAEDYVERLANLPVPKLLIAGEDDKVLPAEALRLDAAATNSEFSVIERACHFITLEKPEAVARLIEKKFSNSKRRK